MDAASEPPDRALGVDRALRTRRELLAALSGYSGRHADAELVRACRAALLKVLPASCRDPVAVDETAAVLAGATLSAQVIAAFAARVAGNLHRLEVGRSIAAWSGSRAPEWVALQLVEALPIRLANSAGHAFSCRVLVGGPAGLTALRFWSERDCATLAPQFGFSKRWHRARLPPKYPFSDSLQLVGLRALGLIPTTMPGERLRLTRVAATPELRKFNREALKRRFRVDPGYVCPQGFAAEFACHHCLAGSASCAAAVHSRDYDVQTCRRCGQAGPCDPRDKGVCVSCVRQSALKR